MRPSYQALPSWLSRVPEVPPTPIMAHRPPEETVLRRALANPRLPLHVVLLAVVLGIAAAAAAGTVRARQAAESHAEMTAFATGKIAQLQAFGALRSARGQAQESPLAPGGSLAEDVPGYSDAVDGTDGRRFLRRWAVALDAAGTTRVVVRLLPTGREAGRAPVDVTTILTGR